MEEKTEALEKAKKDLEDLENAGVASPREIEKAKAKVRTSEAEKVKASNNYLKSVEAEKNKQYRRGYQCAGRFTRRRFSTRRTIIYK